MENRYTGLHRQILLDLEQFFGDMYDHYSELSLLQSDYLRELVEVRKAIDLASH